MDDKLKLKISGEDNLEFGKYMFDEAIKNKKVSEWVQKYLGFIDDNTQNILIKFYEDMYYNNEYGKKEEEKILN